MSFITDALSTGQQLLKVVREDHLLIGLIEKASEAMGSSLSEGGKILSCGNGGSMCDALHFAQELTGRYRKDRPAISAIALGSSPHLTCTGNDYGFDYVFSRDVQALGRKGDCLLAISTSGCSKNVIVATQEASKLNMKTIGLLGKQGGELKNLVDIPLVVPHSLTDRIQEIHIKIIHILIEGIERKLFPKLY